MSAELIPLESALSGGVLARLAHAVKNGAVFVYPTETIYGIGGIYGSETVKQRIYEAKRRPADNPLICVAANQEAFKPLELVWPPAALYLAIKFWPGLLTLVLETADGATAAVRVSPHPIVVALGSLLPIPIYSTSANLSGTPYENDPDIIYENFRDCVEFMIDAGPLPPSRPSTVVSVVRDGTVTIVREGAVPAALVSNAIKQGH